MYCPINWPVMMASLLVLQQCLAAKDEDGCTDENYEATIGENSRHVDVNEILDELKVTLERTKEACGEICETRQEVS